MAGTKSSPVMAASAQSSLYLLFRQNKQTNEKQTKKPVQFKKQAKTPVNRWSAEVAVAVSGGALETEPQYTAGVDPRIPPASLERGSQGRLCVDSHGTDASFC